MLEWRKGIMSTKKKIIIGCIGAVVFLLLASLSNVVGYQSVKPTTVNDSPLFRTRTQRAINQHQNNISFHYLGEGQESPLQFPVRDNRTDLLKRANEYIKNMDDETFNKFTELYLRRLQQKGTTTEMDLEQIAFVLQQFRDGSEYFGLNGTVTMIEMTWSDTPTNCWFPGYLLLIIFSILFDTAIFFFITFLLTVIHRETFCGTCVSHCTNIPDTKEFYYLLNKI